MRGDAWYELLRVLALIFVLEGLLPFLSPRIFRRIMIITSKVPDRLLRIFGLNLMLLGLILMELFS